MSFRGHCWETNSSELEWVSGKWFRHVYPPMGSQHLLFHGMFEKSVILHEEITLSQADTESVVHSAGTHFAISINLHVPLKGKMLCRWAGRVQVEFQNSLLLEIMAKRGGRQTSRVRTSMLFVVVRVGDLRVWVPEFKFLIDCPRKMIGGTDFVWMCCWHCSTSAMWVFKSSKFIINLSIRIFSWLVVVLVVLRGALKPEDDFVRILCFRV